MDLRKKTFFVITGASRGIGQEMAIQMAEKFAEGSVMVLMARSLEGLEKTKKTIESKVNSEKIQVLIFSIDLLKAEKKDFEQVLRNAFEMSRKSVEDFENGFIIHNAGTVGDVSKKAKELSDVKEWYAYSHMNIFSTVALNCVFLEAMKHLPKVVVNVSSKCGIEPFPSMSMYCTGKAARDMYFRCLAAEETDKLLVLNYAPGAIDTDMTVFVQNESCDPTISGYFKQQRDTKTMLTVDKTTTKFIRILEEAKFKSGDHVDYWD